MPLILLLAGKSRCGKDTAASLLVDELGFNRVAFADALKIMCEPILKAPDSFALHQKDMPLAHEYEEYPDARTPRDILLAYASRCRAKDDRIFARMVVNTISDAVEDGQQRFVISDWRWPMEETVLTEAFPLSTILRIRITRDGITPLKNSGEVALENTAIYDFHIENNGSLSTLRDALKSVIRPYLTKH
jgi:hypothetical protein